MSGLLPRVCQVRTTYLSHCGYTKEYWAYEISCGSRAVVAFAWGKIGARKRQFLIEAYSLDTAISVFGKKVEDKKKGGYDEYVKPTIKAATLDGLERAVGADVMTELQEPFLMGGSISYLEWLMEAAGAPSGAWMIPPRAIAAVEDGMDPDGAIERAKRERAEAAARVAAKREATRLADERVAREKAEREMFYASNENWGMF